MGVRRGPLGVGQLFAVQSLKIRLVIEEVELGRPTALKEIDDPLRFRRVMGGGPCDGVGHVGRWTDATMPQRRQRHGTDTRGCPREEVSPSDVERVGGHRGGAWRHRG